MQVKSINNYNRVPFQARIRVSLSGPAAGALGSSILGSSTGGTAAVTASSAAGQASNVLGTAFSMKASGMGSSGIVPSYMEHAASSLSPSVLEASNAHPSIMGTFFSWLGGIFSGSASKVVKNVDPS